MNRCSIGKIGENLAATYLKSLGYQILEANFHSPYGEIDLVCKKDQTLYFVEVKYRRTLKYGTPKESVTQAKINRIKRTAIHYIKNRVDAYVVYKIAFMGIFDDKGTVTYDFIENILS